MARDIIAPVTSLIGCAIHDHKVFTGAAPFNHSPPTTVAVRMLAGIRPDRPGYSSLTDELWDLNQRCWDQEPSSRPEISEVVSHLQNALTAQDDHTDGTDVSTTSKTISGARQIKPSHRTPSFSFFPGVYLRIERLTT